MKNHCTFAVISVAVVVLLAWAFRAAFGQEGEKPKGSGLAPACRILNPKPDEAVTGGTVRVLVEATDDKGVKALKLFVNGIPVPESVARPITAPSKPILASSRDVPPGHKIRRQFVTDVPLPQGEKEILIRASVCDDDGNDTNVTIKVLHAKVTPISSDLHLLCVGISKHRNLRYDIACAATDAEALAVLMQQQEGKQYTRVHAMVLTDAKATKSNIMEALAKLKDAKSSDTIMVFLSAHGVEREGKLYLAPCGLVVNDIEGTCVAWQQVVDTLTGIYAKKLLFADACHAGARLGDRQATSEQLAQAMRNTGIALLTATRGDELSSENGGAGYSQFALALMEAFRGSADANQDGVVTLPELEMYVPQRVSKLTQGLQHPHLVSVEDFNPQTAIVVIK
ncbi:MAG: caspase family protein [Armatimonadetes bacterium]|nr:caspase family protein [Armatimonadota bacterium]